MKAYPDIRFPELILPYTERYGTELITEYHRSGDMVFAVGRDYILKASKAAGRLEREKRANDYLKGRLPVPESVALTEDGGYVWYLRTCVRGEPLVSDRFVSDPRGLADLLAQAMEMVHGVDVSDCDFRNGDSEGDCFIHGDFCLPNLLAADGVISGVIDTEAAGRGDPWVDYAWCVWSFEHNLRTDRYTPDLLDRLGVDFDAEKYGRYTGA